MKKSIVFLYAVLFLLSTSLVFAQPASRLISSGRYAFDAGDGVATNNIIMLDVSGSMGIDNTGATSGTYPNTTTLLTLLAGAKTSALRLDGGTTGLNIVNSATSINATGTIQTTADMKVGPTLQQVTAGPEKLAVLRGNIAAGGGISDGTGFSIIHVPGSGVYNIIFTTAFTGNPSMTASPLNTVFSVLSFAQAFNPNTANATVYTYNAAGVLTDQPFSFVIAGPR